MTGAIYVLILSSLFEFLFVCFFKPVIEVHVTSSTPTNHIAHELNTRQVRPISLTLGQTRPKSQTLRHIKPLNVMSNSWAVLLSVELMDLFGLVSDPWDLFTYCRTHGPYLPCVKIMA